MTDIRIGELAAKYETSGRGVGYISTGMSGKDPGGISYGNYQLETNQGTMAEYISSKESGEFGKMLARYPINSDAFKSAWKKLAQNSPEAFNQSQFEFLANKPNGYWIAYNYAKRLGWSVDSLALQAAIYSTVNQSGGWKNGIFKVAGIKSTDSLVAQINKLYDARALYFERLNINAEVKHNIIKNRTEDERRDALKLIKE